MDNTTKNHEMPAIQIGFPTAHLADFLKIHGVMKRGVFNELGIPVGWEMNCNPADGRGDLPVMWLGYKTPLVIIRGEYSEELTLERARAMVETECLPRLTYEIAPGG